MFSVRIVSAVILELFIHRKLTAEDGRRLHVEGDRNGRAAAAGAATASRADRRDSEPRSAPAGVGLACARVERGEGGGVAPGEVDGRDGRAGAAAVLLGEAAVRGGVLGIHRDEAIRESLDGGRERRVRRRGRGEGAGGDARGELLEEGQRGGRDVDAAERVPDDERVVELLGDGEGSKVPGLKET